MTTHLGLRTRTDMRTCKRMEANRYGRICAQGPSERIGYARDADVLTDVYEDAHEGGRDDGPLDIFLGA